MNAVSPNRMYRTIALIGNPNCGKTTLFNELTGLRQKVGNYPGVTVEKKEGKIQIGQEEITVLDLPGTYSLSANSPDEKSLPISSSERSLTLPSLISSSLLRTRQILSGIFICSVR